MRLVKRFKWKELFNDTLAEPCGYSTPSTEWVILNQKDGFASREDAEQGLLDFAEKSKDFCQLEVLILVEFYSVDYTPEDDVKEILYRKHCGGLYEPLGTSTKVTSLKDIAVLEDLDPGDADGISCKFYANDSRMPAWSDTYVIMTRQLGVLGFTNGLVQ